MLFFLLLTLLKGNKNHINSIVLEETSSADNSTNTSTYNPPSVLTLALTCIIGTITLGCVVLYLCIAKTNEDEKEIISNLLDATPYR